LVIANPPYIRQEELGESKKYYSKTYKVYSGTADILVYFFELGLKVLKEKGILSMITSNKFMRAKYGKPLRNFLWQHDLYKIVDFGELPVFEEAATFPAIYQINNTPNNSHPVMFAQIKTLAFESLEGYIDKIVQFLFPSSFENDNWTLSDSDVLTIIKKMESVGTPLGKYIEGKIYRGILTGFNDAFVINESKKEELISSDPNSNEIIFPYVIGDDIRKYQIRNNNRFIILTKIGVEINKYPAIFRHLKKYQKQLEKRWDKGKYWWELRACDYYSEFSKPKIIFPRHCKRKSMGFYKKKYSSYW